MNEASLEQLNESLRGHESLSEVNDFNELTQKYIDYGETMKTLKGEIEGKDAELKSRVAIPGEGATEEEITAYQLKLGRPETIAGYEVIKPTDWPEELTFDDSLLNSMKEVAFKQGMSKAQFETIANTYLEGEKAAYTEIIKSMDENKSKAVEALQKLWPNEQFKTNSEKVRQGITKFVEKSGIPEGFGGVEGFKSWLTITGMATDPVFNWTMMQIADMMGDDFFLSGSGKGGGEVDILDEIYGKSMPKEQYAR